MPNVNKVILIGNLTRDPQTKQLPGRSTGPSGNSGMVAEFGLAMNRKFKTAEGEGREEVCFVDCAAFGRQAEVIAKYCRKGKQLYVEGRLRYDSWEDKGGHGKRSKLSVVVEGFQFLGGRDDQPAAPAAAAEGRVADERGVPRGNWAGANLPERPERGKPQEPFGERREFKEADIPF